MKTSAAFSLMILVSFVGLHAADWPQWRGPTRDGQITGAAWPDKLDTNHLPQVWRVELAPSYSSRILALDHRGQLFLFRANKEKFDLPDQRKLTGGGDELLVRELNALVAYCWTGQDKTTGEGETETP